MKRLLVRHIGLLPGGVLRGVRVARQRFGFVRVLTEPLSRRLRSDVFVVQAGAARGLRLNAAEGKLGYAFGENEPEVQQTLVELLRAGDVFYDVGANIGFFTLIGARLVGPAGMVHAFEPLAALADALRENVALNGFGNVVVRRAAAYSSAGVAELDVGAGTTAAHLVEEGSARTVQVQLQRVDDLVAAGEIQPPTVVKIDVEGAEDHVLVGMWNTLTEHRPTVICELHGPQEEFLARLRVAEYDVSVLDDGKGVDNPHVLARPR